MKNIKENQGIYPEIAVANLLCQLALIHTCTLQGSCSERWSFPSYPIEGGTVWRNLQKICQEQGYQTRFDPVAATKCQISGRRRG